FSPIYYETLMAMCLDEGFMPTVKYEVRHWLSVVSLVSQNMGISLVPSCLAHSGISGTRFLSFEHAKRSVTRLIWSATPSSRIKQAHAMLILDACPVPAATAPPARASAKPPQRP